MNSGIGSELLQPPEIGGVGVRTGSREASRLAFNIGGCAAYRLNNQLRKFRSWRHPVATISPFRTNAIRKSATLDAWLLALKM